MVRTDKYAWCLMGAIALVVLSLVLIPTWFFWRSASPNQDAPTIPSPPHSESRSNSPINMPSNQPPRDGRAGFSPLADQINRSSDPTEDVRLVHDLIAQMRSNVSRIASIPLGTNREFTAVLTGNNPDRLAAIPPDHAAINLSGEICDRYGTPYHFHPISSQSVEVRSAGPDLQLFTDDDLLFSPLSR